MKKKKIISHRLLNLFHSVLLIAGMLVLLSALGLSFAGVKGLLWASLIAIPLLLLGQRIPPQLILRMYGARPLSVHEAPGLYQLFQELVRRADLPEMPRLYYIPIQSMNALTVGSREDAILGITDGLLRGLSTRELTGVLAHEITHIRHNDMHVTAFADLVSRITGLFSTFGQMLLFLNLPLLLIGVSPVSWFAVVLLIIAPTLSSLLRLALSRTREFDADLGAARLTGDPGGLACALQKMERYETSLLKRILLPGHRVPGPPLFRTHPETSERVRRLLGLTGAKHPASYACMVR